MRRFIAQVIVNALTILVVLFVFSLIKVDYTDPFTEVRFTGPALALGANPVLTLVFMALFVALVASFVRPVVLVLAGRLLLRSMGLILIVVNVILVFVAGWLAPGEFVVAQPTWFWGTLIALVFTLLASGIQIVVGIDRPQIDMSDRQRAIWRLLDRLPTPRRSKLVENLRLMQVYNTVASFGFEIGLESTPVAVIRDRFQKYIGGMNRELAVLSTPAKVRVMLQQLGPTYVKIGQMISSRAEALPQDWQEELTKLQNTVPPFPAAKAHEIIQAELKQPASELYATFDEEALAAASLAQVHRATLPDGREVVVKIQRPDVQTMVAADLGVMQDLAGVMEDRFELARRMDARGILEEFAAGVLVELDYRNEAYHMRRLAENMSGIEGVRVPDVDGMRSARRVLTMEFIRGVKISDVAAMEAAGIDRDVIARNFLRAIIKQVLVDGFFHADPHPGNVLVDTRDGTIVFLDLGLIGQLNRDQRFDLLDLMWSVVQKDAAGIASVVTRMSTQRGTVDPDRVRSAIDAIVYQYLKYGGEGGGDFGAAISGILGTLYDNGLKLNQDFTLALKAIVQVEEITRTLSPSFSLLDEGLRNARELLTTEVSAEKIVAALRQTTIQTGKELGRRLPDLQSATLSWLDQYQKGKIVVEVNTADLSREIGRVSQIGQMLAAGLVIAGMLVATGIVFTATLLSGTNIVVIFPLPIILLFIFVTLLVVAVRVTNRMLRRPGEPDR
ncbi:MAG: AarF/UbiB family protein [Chloroflexi bacterium]|jgi:ubiquinone biosynthesis protein|nr:AarF/UbiB family protein [Chloroflexota bacterium]